MKKQWTRPQVFDLTPPEDSEPAYPMPHTIEDKADQLLNEIAAHLIARFEELTAAQVDPSILMDVLIEQCEAYNNHYNLQAVAEED